MKEYVVGLAFTPNRREVLLLQKRHGPPAVIGRWNGLGGSVEEGETIDAAMAREFLEECGLKSNPEDWTYFGSLATDLYGVHFLTCVHNGLRDAQTLEDEEVKLWDVDHVLMPNVALMHNLRWMIPLCCDPDLDIKDVFLGCIPVVRTQ